MATCRAEIEETNSSHFVRGEDECDGCGGEGCGVLAHALLLVELTHDDGSKDTYNKAYCPACLAEALDLIQMPTIDFEALDPDQAEGSTPSQGS